MICDDCVINKDKCILDSDECVKLRNSVKEKYIQAKIEAENFKWHDLRKNPEDLPKDWEDVLIYTYRCEYIVAYIRRPKGWYISHDDDFTSYDIDTKRIIAWKEIELFEEE